MSRLRSIVAIVLLGSAVSARAERPADGLMRLVPDDAGVALAVEDLRGHVLEFLDSPLAKNLYGLPAVKAWFASDRAKQLRQSRGDMEKALGTSLTTVRDDLLGDAVVLALQPGPDGTPEQAKGLLLLKARDRDLLDRLIRAFNENEKREGALVDVAERRRGDSPYSVRLFRPGTKEPEAYAILPGDVFAWSNSEALIQGVIDRGQGRGSGLGDVARFRKVRSAMPARAVASLFIDPRFLERAGVASPEAAKPEDERLTAYLRRYLAAVDYAGAALEWKDGLLLHVHEAIELTKLDDPWRRWAAREGDADGLVRRVPPSALALAAGPVDLAALTDAALGLVPEAERPKADNLMTIFRGVLLGRDPRREILPNLGPGLVTYVDTPPEGSTSPHFPFVAALSVGGDSGVASAIDNALRTLLALTALDPKRSDGPLRIETRESGGVRVTTLSGARFPFAYAVERGMIVIGTSVEAVAGFAAAEPREGTSDSPFGRLRARYFPKAETFAFADLIGLHRWANAHRAELSRRVADDRHAPVDEARRDLDQVLALISLFRGAYATSAIDKDFTSAHRVIGLIARDEGAK